MSLRRPRCHQPWRQRKLACPSVSGRMSKNSLKPGEQPCEGEALGLTWGEEEFGCGFVKPRREGTVLLRIGRNVFPH